jgi:hypothetical protein
MSLCIVNLEQKPLFDLTLRDWFFPADVVFIAPKEEFFQYSDFENDNMHMWKKSIKEIKPRARLRFTYRIRLRTNVKQLKETFLYKGSELITFSNTVKISFLLEAPAPPADRYIVYPVGWNFDFTDDDHHINIIKAICNHVRNEDDELSWQTHVKYEDKNGDDNYRWRVNHGILKIPGIYRYAGNSGTINDGGGSASKSESFTHDDLKAYENATVILRGWSFNFDDNDHEIKKVNIRLKDITFDPAAGKVSWKVEANYEDNNRDDNYDWVYYYEVIGFNNGIVKRSSRSGTKAKRNITDISKIKDDALKNYDIAIAIPSGYSFNFRGDEHNLNEIGFNLANNNYNRAIGQVNWVATMNFADKNYDDEFDWWYSVDVLALNFAQYRESDSGTFSSSGGGEDETFEKQLSVLFAPVTWFDGVMNGSETGVDCGGNSPIHCVDCIKSSVNIGDADDADLYSLSEPVVESVAMDALQGYVEENDLDFDAYYQGVEKADRYVEAVAWYVEKYMLWIEDAGDWEGTQKALITSLGIAKTTASCGPQC